MHPGRKTLCSFRVARARGGTQYPEQTEQLVESKHGNEVPFIAFLRKPFCEGVTTYFTTTI